MPAMQIIIADAVAHANLALHIHIVIAISFFLLMIHENAVTLACERNATSDYVNKTYCRSCPSSITLDCLEANPAVQLTTEE